MRPLRFGLLSLTVVLFLVGCGAKPMVPELITREIPTLGNTRTDAGVPVDLNIKPDASVTFGDAGTCCSIQVAIAAGDETVAYVRDFSSGNRFGLTKSSGVWRGQLCVSLEQTKSYYYYEVGYSLDDADAGIVDGGEFLQEAVNRGAPIEGLAAVGEANVFTPSGMVCTEQDAGIHSQFFDAGIVQGDAGP